MSTNKGFRNELLNKFKNSRDSMYRTAEELIIHDAIELMSEHDYLDEFVMSIGSWYFIDKDGNYKYGNSGIEYIDNSPLASFINEWDKHIKLTNNKLRVKVNGPIIRN